MTLPEKNEQLANNDETAKNKFIEEMNRRAGQIGMTHSNFVEPAGFPSTIEHTMSTRDMVKMGIQASGYKELARIWNKKSYTFHIKGPNQRELKLDTNVGSPIVEDEYYMFGGKPGSIGSVPELNGKHMLMVTSAPNGNWFVAAVRNGSTAEGRNLDLKKALDNSKLMMDDPDASLQEIKSESAAVCLMPMHNPFAYEQYDIPLLYKKNADVPGHPASVTKVMSAIVLLDEVLDLDEKLEIHASDIKPGTGPDFYEGDIFTLKDALYCMMLPSSNSATHAVARIVGNKLLNKGR